MFSHSLLRDSGYLNYSATGIASNLLMLYVDATNSSSYSGTGTIWYDLSGNANNITLVNCVYTGSKSFYFNGSTSYAYSPSIYTLFTTSNANLNQTIEIWFKNYNAGNVVNEVNAVTTPAWYDTQLEMITSSTLKGRVWNLSSPYLTYSNSGPFNSNFVYACLRYNGSSSSPKIDGYFNSIYIPSVNYTRQFSPSPANYYVTLGQSLSTNMGSGLALDGNISIFRTYKRALSDTEILQNYNTDKSKFGL